MLTSRVLAVLSLAAVGVVGGLATTKADTRASGAGRGCHRGTIAQNRYLSLYRRRPGILMVCDRSSGKTFVETYGYVPRTAKLRGPKIAYAYQFCDYDDIKNFCNTFLLASDVINDPNGGSGAEAGPRPWSKVGSVQLSRDLRLAWIACRLRHRPRLEQGSAAATAVRQAGQGAQPGLCQDVG